MKNKLTDNDPRLTAYALGELTRAEAEEITNELAAPKNAALKRDVEELDALGVMLTQTLATPEASTLDLEGSNVSNASTPQLKLSAAQRAAIFRSAKAPKVSDVRSANQSRWLRPVVVTLAAAALVTFTFVMLDNVEGDSPGLAKMPSASYSDLQDGKLHAPILPSNHAWEPSSNRAGDVSSHSGHSNEVAFSADQGLDQTLVSRGVSIGDDTELLSTLIEKDWVKRADSAIVRMPLVSGKASWEWVRQSILKDQTLPDKNAIRAEEIINSFDYNVSPDLELKHASVAVDLVRCPWNAKHLIAAIVVENIHDENIQIETAVNFSSSVNQYRIIGYASAQNVEENFISPSKITMAKEDGHLVMYEIIPEEGLENAADILSLDIRTTSHSDDAELVRDANTLDVQYSDRQWTKASQDIQFALLLATWSQLIADSAHDGNMNAEEMQNMLTHFESNFTPTTQQADALNVLRKGSDLVQ